MDCFFCLLCKKDVSLRFKILSRRNLQNSNHQFKSLWQNAIQNPIPNLPIMI